SQRAGTLRRMLTQLAFQSRRAAVELTTIALSACRYFAPHAYSACLPKSPSCCRADDFTLSACRYFAPHAYSACLPKSPSCCRANYRALSVQVLRAAGSLSLPSGVAELLLSWHVRTKPPNERPS